MSADRLSFLNATLLVVALASMNASAQPIAFDRLDLYGGPAGTVRLGSNVLITRGGTYALYRSTDVGDSWQALSLENFNGGAISDIATADDGGLAFAAGMNGLFRSTDLGATWSLDSGVFAGRSVKDVSITPSGRLVTVRIDSLTASALWRSLDSGRTWTRAFDPMIRDYNAYALLDDTTLIAAASYRVDTVMRTRIMLSTDAGATWSTSIDTVFRFMQPKLLGNGRVALIRYVGGLMASLDLGRTWGTPATPWTSSIEHLHLNDRTVFASLSDGSLHRSDDAAQSWSVVGEGFEREAVRVSAKFGDTLIGSTRTEALRSVDSGRTWTPTNRGLLLQRFGAIASGRSGEIHVAAGSVLFSSTDGGDTWTRTGRPMLPELTVINVVQPLADGAVMVGGVGGPFFSSPSRGVWNSRVRGLGGSAFERNMFSADLGATGDLVIGSYSGVFRFRYEDSVWAAVGLQGFGIPSVAVGRDGALYAAGTDINHRGIWRMEPGTFEWNQFIEGLAGVDAADMAVGYDSTVYLASMSGFYRTRRSVSGWERIDASLPVSDFKSIAVHRSGAVATSTRSSLLFSQDGISWTVIDSGLPARIQSIAFDTEGRLFVSTDQDGIHRSRERVAMVADGTRLAKDLVVRASPIPATSAMSFEIHSMAQRPYHLEIFDARGGLCLESMTEPGAGRVDIDVSMLAPGRYTYRLSYEAESATGVFIVTR